MPSGCAAGRCRGRQLLVCCAKDERQPKADSTLRSSRAVPHPSTNRALRRLTSEVGRDPVCSTRYGRQRYMSEDQACPILPQQKQRKSKRLLLKSIGIGRGTFCTEIERIRMAKTPCPVAAQHCGRTPCMLSTGVDVPSHRKTMRISKDHGPARVLAHKCYCRHCRVFAINHPTEGTPRCGSAWVDMLSLP